MPQASCLWCERFLLFNPLFSNSLNSLSSAFENNNSRSRLSLLPPVPQNLSPSLAVLGISPITQIDSFPSTRLPPRSRVSFLGGGNNYNYGAKSFIGSTKNSRDSATVDWKDLFHQSSRLSKAFKPFKHVATLQTQSQLVSSVVNERVDSSESCWSRDD